MNVLIYLNEDWLDSYGGQLEFWDAKVSERIVSVLPIFNRCVIFETDSTSMHGVPNAVRHPKGGSRRCVAIYYYTATWHGRKKSHSTKFRARPRSNDQFDWSAAIDELSNDLLPPMLVRGLYRLKDRLRYQIKRLGRQ